MKNETLLDDLKKFGRKVHNAFGPVARYAAYEILELRKRLAEVETERDQLRVRAEKAEASVAELKADSRASLELLARWWYAYTRDGWEDSEVEDSVTFAVVAHLSNTISTEWPSGWDRDRTLKAIRELHGGA